MSRPLGEERKAIRRAAEQLAAERLADVPDVDDAMRAEASAATWRDLGAKAGVGFTVARRTVENMARAGELTPIGAKKLEHSRRWMTLYALPAPAPCSAAAAPVIDSVMRSWSRP